MANYKSIGRPRKDNKEVFGVNLAFSATKEDDIRVRKYIKKHGISISELMRRAVRRYLDDER